MCLTSCGLQIPCISLSQARLPRQMQPVHAAPHACPHAHGAPARAYTTPVLPPARTAPSRSALSYVGIDGVDRVPARVFLRIPVLHRRAESAERRGHRRAGRGWEALGGGGGAWLYCELIWYGADGAGDVGGAFELCVPPDECRVGPIRVRCESAHVFAVPTGGRG